MNLFLDTSALTKLYHREVGTERLMDFLTRPSNEFRIIVSDLTRIEFRSVLSKKFRRQEIGAEDVIRLYQIFEADMFRFQVVEIGNAQKRIAAELFTSLGPNAPLRTLDALQLATAITINEEIKIGKFVCCDRGLIECASRFFSIFNPESDIV